MKRKMAWKKEGLIRGLLGVVGNSSCIHRRRSCNQVYVKYLGAFVKIVIPKLGEA